MDGTTEKSIKLEIPLEIKLKAGWMSTITELKFGRVKAKHFKVIPQAMLDGKSVSPIKLLPLIAMLSGISTETAEEIDLVDLMRIVNVVTGLLEGESTPSKISGTT